MLHFNDNGQIEKDGEFEPIEELKGLLVSEHASISSFEHCLETPAAAGLHTVAAACLEIHLVNQRLLTERLGDMGVAGASGTDLWHTLLEIIGSTATVFGEEAILMALRKNELDLLSLYEGKAEHFDSESMLLLKGTLIPNQVKICQLLGAIKTDISAQVPSQDVPLQLNWGMTA
jgi:hypothetical protein